MKDTHKAGLRRLLLYSAFGPAAVAAATHKRQAPGCERLRKVFHIEHPRSYGVVKQRAYTILSL
ncbi:hypothetical protein A3D62_01205 [Candidatus Kaiserbacteria bacterium RIFCSPHIGHO2_02_FULL_49_11]|uniref:Uncharacterized protein n=1 Tax=Candidatus Kaiserbacteria bacterium RIFCSPHIGHO2_02_FULL_49_11 TaxID=1798489 RepID=A0A1F6CZU2_9BACT|nr:MAG: hypothetical protein A3D62_01205 [Candidatus Kaiserbacteria bacterium RIFCSPHIGHO2_02_FULL_49_11]